MSIRYYSIQDGLGNELADVRWLRLGHGRWYIEGGKWGIVARLGSIHLALHYDPASEDV